MANELRIARTDRTVQPASGPLRHFVGLRAVPHSDTLLGSLVQVTGQGLTSRAETIATARLSDPRMVDHPDEASRSVEVAAFCSAFSRFFLFFNLMSHSCGRGEAKREHR